MAFQPYPVRGRAAYKKTLIKHCASIGSNATVVCGHTVGEWTMIAAGAVVTSNIPKHALMMGVPARLRGWVFECGDVLSDDLVCNRCGRTYKDVPEGLEEAK